MNIVLWILQGLVAIMFLMHGIMMINPSERVREGAGMAYVMVLPTTGRRLIGVAEILAAVGLIVPALTGILPVLTPLAATGLVILMVSAIIFHIPRKEPQNIMFNAILLILAAFVAYGRFFIAPL